MRNEPLVPELEDPELEETRRLLNRSMYDRLKGIADARKQSLRLQRSNRIGLVRYSRAIHQMMTDRGLSDGPECEFFTEIARARSESLDPHRIILPIRFLDEQRDLTVAQATAGGYLVGTDLGEAQDVLRPWSIVLSGGVTVEEQLTGNVTIPKTLTGTSITWQANESSQAPPTTPSLAQAAMTPKIGIVILQASHNFMMQANPERWLRRELTRVAGVSVDTAVLNGSGASGQPLGILNSSGLSTQSGTALAWAGALAMKKNVALANMPDGSTSFISTPTVRALLEAREKAAGNGGFVWQDDRIANCPAFATTLMPAGAMLSGPLAGVTVGLWSDLRIEINPFDSTLFKSGVVQIRVLVACDAAIVVDPSSFTLASSIT